MNTTKEILPLGQRYSFQEVGQLISDSGDLVQKSIVLIDNKTDEAYRFTAKMHDEASSSPSITVEKQKKDESGHRSTVAILQCNEAKEAFNLLKDVAKVQQTGNFEETPATDMVKTIKKIAPNVNPKTLTILKTSIEDKSYAETAYNNCPNTSSKTYRQIKISTFDNQTGQKLSFLGTRHTVDQNGSKTENVLINAYNGQICEQNKIFPAGINKAIKLLEQTQDELWANPNEALDAIVDMAKQERLIKAQTNKNR